MPEGDEGFIFAADKPPGEAVAITLRSAVKTALFRQPVHHFVSGGGGGAVLANQRGHTSGSAVYPRFPVGFCTS